MIIQKHKKCKNNNKLINILVEINLISNLIVYKFNGLQPMNKNIFRICPPNISNDFGIY